MGKFLKNALISAGTGALLALIFWPWALGATDVATWAITGQQYSDIPWGSLRGLVLFLWPPSLLLATGLVMSILFP